MKTLIFLSIMLFNVQSFAQSKTSSIILAGGCFWCVEQSLEQVNGVLSAVSGYSGGHVKNPKYQKVSLGDTGHREAVEIVYDPNKVSLENLLREFFKNIDPTDEGGQFADRGYQYSSAIYYKNKMEEKIALKVINSINKKKVYKKPIVTKLEKYKNFYKAEEYHQDYYKKHPVKYKFYKYRSGRSSHVEKYKDLL